MPHRDIEIIKRDIEIAELRESNTALQVDAHMKTIQILQAQIDVVSRAHFEHRDRKKALEAELAAAVIEDSGEAQPSAADLATAKAIEGKLLASVAADAVAATIGGRAE